jgi:hypothetical protein
MSALRSFQQAQTTAVGGVKVPKSYVPDVDRALLDANARDYEFPASSGSFAPGQISQIMIPQSACRYLLGGSLYLNCTVQVTGTATQQNTAYITYFTGGPTKSAAALISRLTISTSGGTILTDIVNYPVWHNIILCHASNLGYKQDAMCQEHAYGIISTEATGDPTDETIALSIPLASGLFNQVKAFPLWAISGPLIIQIQWSQAADCIGIAPAVGSGLLIPGGVGFPVQAFGPGYTNTAGVTGITVPFTYAGSLLGVRCMMADVDPEYIAEQKLQMAQGRMLTYNYQNVVGLQTNSGAASINFGVNCSSLLAVFGAQLLTDARSQIANSIDAFGTGAWLGSWGYSQNYLSNIRVFRDGTQLSAFPICQSGRDDAFAPLQQALGILFSTSNSTHCTKVNSEQKVPGADDHCRFSYSSLNAGGSLTTPIFGAPGGTFNIPPVWGGMKTYESGSVYAPSAFVWGLSARKCNDDDISNSGSQCSQLQFTTDADNAAGAVSTATHYLFYLFSASATFDLTGNCAVRR